MVPPKPFAAALLCVWLATALPIAIADLPPLVDYPAHLARVHILAHWGQLAGYEKFYRPAWGILPNLGLDLICVPVATILPTEVTMRLFCALVAGVLIWGGALLNRAVSGRWTVWSLAPALLVYNYIQAFGFLNYLLGIGVGLFALALHIHGRRQPLAKRVVREFVFMLALFISHFVALAVYLVAAAAFDALSTIAERRGWKELALDYAVLAGVSSVAAVLLLFSPTGEKMSTLDFSGVGWKLTKLAEVFQTGQGVWDVVFAIAFVAALALLIARRYLRVEWVMAGVAAVLFVLFAITPYRINAASNLDTRLPIVVLYAGIAALVPGDSRGRLVLGTFLALFVFRVSTTTVHYQRSSAELAHIKADLSAIPADSLLFTTHQSSAPVSSPDDWHPPRAHAADLLLLSQPLFSATFFTNPTQQPLVRSPLFQNLSVPPEIGDASRTELDGYADRMIARLSQAGRSEPTYVYLMKGTAAPARTPRFEVIVDRPRYAVYRLVR